MAVRTIKASGGDYTTLTAWEAALPATLSAVETADCDNFDLTDTLAISGITTSSANYIEVKASGAARHDGRSRTVSGTGFRLKRTTAAGTTLAISANHVRITGIEIEAQSTSSAIQATGSFAAGANDVRIENCIIHDVNTGSGYTLNLSVANLNLTLRNNVIYGYQRTLDTRNAASVLSENNTCWRHAAQLGLVSDSELVCKNTYSGHAGAAAEDFWTGGAAPSGNNNASSDTTQATDYTAGVSSIAGSAVFVSVTAGAEDFTLKSGTNALVDAGATLGTVTADIIGTARPAGSAYDIGAFERASTGSTQNLAASGAAQASGSASQSAALALGASGSSVAGGSAGAAFTIAVAGAGVSVSSGSAQQAAAISMSAIGVGNAVGQGDNTIAISLSASGLAEAIGQADLVSGSMQSLEAAGEAVAAGSASVRLQLDLAAVGEASALGQATHSIEIELSAAAIAQAAGSGELVIHATLEAIGAGQVSGTATLQLFEESTDELYPLAGASQAFKLAGQTQGFPLAGQTQTFISE